jgi:hypothetical protein
LDYDKEFSTDGDSELDEDTTAASVQITLLMESTVLQHQY